MAQKKSTGLSPTMMDLMYDPYEEITAPPPLQPMPSHLPTMQPMPSHDPTIATTPNSKFMDFFKGVGQNTASDALYLNDLIGAPIKPLTNALPESVSQFMPGGSMLGARDQFEKWSQPQNKEQFVGNLWGSAVTPGPDELLVGAKALKMMGFAGSLDDIAKRLGHPPGTFTSELRGGLGNSYETLIRDNSGKTHDIDWTQPSIAGRLTYGTQSVPGNQDYMPIFSSKVSKDYHDKGLGTEMYKEALDHAKQLGYKGLASEPYMRNDFSKEVWDRPMQGFYEKDSHHYYDLMSDYTPRGKEWKGTPLENLFEQDRGPRAGHKDTIPQPMLPEVKEYLLDQMKNKPAPFKPAGPRANPSWQAPTTTPSRAIKYETDEKPPLMQYMGDYTPPYTPTDIEKEMMIKYEYRKLLEDMRNRR